MTGLLLLMSLCTYADLHGEPWDLMETGALWYWTCGTAMAGEGRLLFDGEPFVLVGDPGLPPMGSFTSVRQYNPLEGGLWSSSGWSLDFETPAVPDSSYESMVGLLENTANRNRYMAYLRRPLPGSLRFGLSAGREDTVSAQRIGLGLGDMDFIARFRQGDGDRYMLSLGWLGASPVRIRGGFCRMYPGSRQAELYGSTAMVSGGFSVEAGAGGSWLADSLVHGELHLLTRLRPGAFLLTARADLTDDDGELEAGGAGGCSVDLGPVGLQAGVYAAPGDDPSFLLQADAGPATARALLSGGRVAAGADLDLSIDHLLARGSVTAWESDSLSLAGSILPWIRYWNARITAGARCDLSWADGEGWSGTVDLLSAFTLGRFAFVLAVEDVDYDPGRSWTFGISWEFTDRPPSIDTGEDEGRGGEG